MREGRCIGRPLVVGTWREGRQYQGWRGTALLIASIAVCGRLRMQSSAYTAPRRQAILQGVAFCQVYLSHPPVRSLPLTAQHMASNAHEAGHISATRLLARSCGVRPVLDNVLRSSSQHWQKQK